MGHHPLGALPLFYQEGFTMRERKRFPTSGIFRVIGGICPSYYECAADARRYRYIAPSDLALPDSWVSDCWIVDKDGMPNPGTCHSAIPIRREDIGRRITEH